MNENFALTKLFYDSGFRLWLSAMIFCYCCAACRSPEGEFKQARAENSLQAYNQFLASYSEHPLALIA